MVYSLVQEDFAAWVKAHIDARNQKITVTNNLLIDMDPEVAAAFAASTAVSSKYLVYWLTLFKFWLIFWILASKGIGANLLKVGTKRRRTTAEIKAEKEEELVK